MNKNISFYYSQCKKILIKNENYLFIPFLTHPFKHTNLAADSREICYKINENYFPSDFTFNTIRIVGCVRVKNSYFVIYSSAVICEGIFKLCI